MTTTLSAERVEELREWVSVWLESEHKDERSMSMDVLAIIDSYSSLRAEVKRLKKAIDETGRLDTERIQAATRRKP